MALIGAGAEAGGRGEGGRRGCGRDLILDGTTMCCGVLSSAVLALERCMVHAAHKHNTQPSSMTALLLSVDDEHAALIVIIMLLAEERAAEANIAGPLRWG